MGESGTSLHDILKSFNGPVNEEQAWAICYQVIKSVVSSSSHEHSNQLRTLASHNDLLVQKDGSVTISRNAQESCEKKFLASLGVVLFEALDYGYDEHEERSLDPSLESLIERLTSADSVIEPPPFDGTVDDEGIERDAGEEELNSLNSDRTPQIITLESALEACCDHLKLPDQAEKHYRAVCRALFAEAQDLATFLAQISKGTKELRKISGNEVQTTTLDASLDQLCVTDWARLWMSLIKELRNGVMLKKVNPEELCHRTEFELTPYEMLLDDIRCQRYKLKHVEVNGDILQKVKKDAHELIFEFIRSRPPLVPASRRKLAPRPTKQQSLYDKLMHSIRQEHKLRPTPPPSVRASPFLGRVTETVETSRTKLSEEDVTPAPRRRLIKADLNLRLSNSFEEEDDDIVLARRGNAALSIPRSSLPSNAVQDIEEDDEEEDNVFNGTGSGSKVFRKKMISNRRSSSSYSSSSSSSKASASSSHPPPAETEDDLLDRPTTDTTPRRKFSFRNLTRFLSFDGSNSRRHSITVCESPSGSKASSSGGHKNSSVGRNEAATSSTISQKLKRRESNNNQRVIQEEELVVDPNEDTRERVASIWAATDWGKTYDCLSLTLDEIQHIRSVLTKAELESLGVTRSLREDLENGRICFTCLKTRFSFFGPWKIECRLCERAICEKCCTKMHIPTEAFEKVPIYMLSPTPTPSPPGDHVGDDSHYFPTFPMNIMTHEDSRHDSSHHGGGNKNDDRSSTPSSGFFSLRGSHSKKSKLMRALNLGKGDTKLPDDGRGSEGEGEPSDKSLDSNLGSLPPSSGETNDRKSGPLLKLCRDCKLLVRHIIDVGYTNYDSNSTSQFQNRGRRSLRRCNPSPLPHPTPASTEITIASSSRKTAAT